MKKIIITVSLLSFLSLENFAQEITSEFYGREFPPILENCVAPPVNSRLYSYQEFTFRHSTGQVDIQIPIHELKVNSLSLPIGISYNTSGIKIQDNPGLIGYGWSLNCGFKISRTVRGKDDLEYPVIQEILKDFASSASSSSETYLKQLVNIAPEDTYNRLNASGDYKMDGQYDIFRIELPNLSVSFILEYINGEYRARTLRPSPLSIRLLTHSVSEKVPSTGFFRNYTDLYGIEVTDDNGICYRFGESQRQSSWKQNKYTEYNKHSTYSGSLKTGWMLREILLSPGNVLTFKYKDAIDYLDFQPTMITSVLHRNFQIQDPNASTYLDLLILRGDPEAAIRNGNQNHIEYNLNLTWIREKNRGTEEKQATPEPNNFKLLRSISNSRLEIEFNYDSIQKIGDPDVPAGSSYYRQNLSNLKVFSRVNNQRVEKVKEINFINREGFLESLSISGNGTYKFSYDRRDKNFTTEQFQKAIDWWGYCNGKNNVSSIPRDDTNGTAENKRAPDSLYTKTRALEKITYPTGGSLKINYGTHYFQDGLFGAGLRVKSLETHDPSSGQTMIKKFRYENPRYSGIPYSNCSSTTTTHLYAGKDVTLLFPGNNKHSYHAFAYEVDILSWTSFTFSRAYTPYTPFHVWYENVTEENEEGKTEYKFEYTPYAYDSEFINGTIDYTMSHGEPSLTRQSVFKKNVSGGFDLVKTIENTYSRDFTRFCEVNVVGFYREVSTYGMIFRQGNYSDLRQLEEHQYPSRVSRVLAVGQVSLRSMRETQYFQNDNTSTTTTYLYDNERPYNLVVKTIRPKNSDIITQKYYYSNNQLPVNKGVTTTDHGLNGCATHKTAVIQQETHRNGKLVGSSLTYFKTINSTQKVPKEKYYSGPDGVMEKREEFRSYDSFGNPVEIIKDKYSYMARLWGYGGQYPVAEIRNATASQVSDLLGWWTSLFSLHDTIPDEFWTDLNNFRLAQGFENALITTYKYKPLVGVVEMVDPRGISTYYDYDVYGRLKEVYIMENGSKKLLQENTYKYYN